MNQVQRVPRKPRSPAAVFIVVGMSLGIIAVLSILLLVGVGQLQETANALKTSSARNECRARILNSETEIKERARITVDRNTAALIVGFRTNDDAKIDRALTEIQDATKRILDRQDLQYYIDRQCPAPLVPSEVP